MDDKTEPNNISGEVKNSLASTNQPTPQTITCKNELQGNIALIEGTKQQYLTIYNHFHSIGADNQILVDDKQKNRAVLQKWFQVLVIQNRRFPTDIPIDFVLDDFFNAILQRRVTLKGFNLLAHMEAFHEYIDNFRHELQSRWWAHRHPSERPKELPEAGSYSEQEKRMSDRQRSEAIKAMYNDNIPEGLKKYVIGYDQEEGDNKQSP